MHKAHDYRRNMNSVRNHLNRNAVFQINRFDCSGVLIDTDFVVAGHGVIKVGGVGETGFVASFNIVIFGRRVTERCQNTFRSQIACKFLGTGKFRRRIPTFDTWICLDKHLVIFLNRRRNEFGNLSTGHLRVKVRTFEMESENTARRIIHHFLTSLGCILDHLNRRRRKRRINRRCAVSAMSFNRNLESFFRSFHKVASATTVNVKIDTAREYIIAFSIDHFVNAVENFRTRQYTLDFHAVNENTSALNPSGRSKYFSVNNLSRHVIVSFNCL